MTKQVMYFTVDPQSIVELARQRYWFEENKKHGVSILNCFIGIEPYQITRILEGNATVNENREYIEVSDDDFKQKLADFLAYRKKMDVDLISIGGIKVQRDLVDEYAGHVVKRLRETMRNTKHGIMLDFKDMEEILGLEHQRRDLHDAILHNAGFDRDDTSDEACAFKVALEEYVNKQAGTILDESIDDMDSDEAANKRKQSDNIANYIDSMNIAIAKSRGII